jgi:hypothetical protein
MRFHVDPGERLWDGHSIRQAQGMLCPSNADSKINSGRFSSSKIVALALLITLAPWASGQRAGSAHTSPHAHVVQHSIPHQGIYSHRGRHSYPYSPYASLPFPFFTDAFDPGDIYSTGYPLASEPPPYLLQAAAAMAASGANPLGRDLTSYDRAPSSQPLMIELQNGRYVRVRDTEEDSKNGEAQELTSAPEKSKHASSTPAPRDPAPAPTLPPAVLIFRDGHSEEVRDYAIADGILYARGDYYAEGYWNKKIALSTLNVAQTMQANTARNVKFVLPSSPNEVITRP